MRREFLQLAEILDVEKHRIGGYYISEKLDGTRCFWDGGLTRGLPTEDVPWASITDPKTGERRKKIKPVATGLWSRYGNPITSAPDWFLDSLPRCFLDGELWAGRQGFQLCRSICGGDKPDPRFNKIKYAVYSAPSWKSMFQSGEIKNANMHCTIDESCVAFIARQAERLAVNFDQDFDFCQATNFQQELLWMNSMLETQSDTCFMHRQEKLPLDEGKAHVRVAEMLDYVLEQGGEGVVLRDPQSQWTPKRHVGILKYKPYKDAEGTITGFTSGRETTKGSRLLGRIGALIVDYEGKRLELSGLTDDEHLFQTTDMVAYATAHTGVDMPGCFRGVHFKVGQTVSFKYRELTDDGIPKEARYWRRRDEE